MTRKEELLKKWSEVAGKMSIASIADEYIKENLAQLLENQETKNVSAELIGESFTTSTPTSTATGQFEPIALALVRRTFPELFANKVVGVQAMNGPVGLAYALRFLYAGSTRQAATNHEAGWDKVPEHSGYTGSISGTSGTADTGTGAGMAAAEAWALGTQMPELKLALTRDSFTAASRKLAASFSLEAAQDIKAMHNIDIEREMVNILQYEIMAELDRELIYKLKAVAVDTSKGGEAASSVDCSGGLDGRWQQERLAGVITTIVKKCNDIATSTRRGAGNFVIVSPRVATALQSAGSMYKTIGGDILINATTTMALVGTINGVISVYRDSYATSDYALCGYKGPGLSDCGIIYAPYITGLISKAIAQEDFSPRIGVMSRYAIVDSLLGSGRYYRLINYSNLDLVLGL